MKNLFTFFISIVFIASCSMDERVEETTNLLDNEYFTEFMQCKAGPDYSAENMAKMIADWQPLITADQLIGVWGYAPASEKNLYPDTGWWELQWTSKEAAEAAWNQWVQNAEVAAWQEKYKDVLVCNGEARNGFESVFPLGAEEFGDLPKSGYFFSAVWLCKYNEGYGVVDAKEFLPKFTKIVRNSSGYAGTSYHFGNYYSDSNPDADFLWGDFTNSRESMTQATNAFQKDVQPTMFPLFSEFAACGETPDEYNGWMLYDAENKDFMPTFLSNKKE